MKQNYRREQKQTEIEHFTTLFYFNKIVELSYYYLDLASLLTKLINRNSYINVRTVRQ